MYWLLGGTGSGKTYTAISRAAEKGRFAYISPTRLLAIETFESYGDLRDGLSVGTVHIPGNGNFFGTYGQLKLEEIKDYKTVIIDEAHYIDGDFLNHRKKIRSVIKEAQAEGVEVIALTATPPYNLKSYHVETLPGAVLPPKTRVSYERTLERMKAGVKTLVISTSRQDAREFSRYSVEDHDVPQENIARAWRGMKDIEIYQEFLKFKEGNATVLVCSNIAQQGINLPCENLICFTKGCDDYKDMAQKLGRLGRPFMTHPDAELTWYDDYHETLHQEFIKDLKSWGDYNEEYDDEPEPFDEWDGTPPDVAENPYYTEEEDEELREGDDDYREETDHALTQFLKDRMYARHNGAKPAAPKENVNGFSFQDEDGYEFLGYSGRRGGAMYRNKTGRIRVAA